MKLTCVTAVFNAIRSGHGDHLVQCINSIAALKTEHEHLVYDGASNDGTVEVLRELEKKTPGLKVVSEPDTGIYNALNKGVRDAKGEWFYVLGCDDYLLAPENLDAILANAPEADLISSPTWLDWGNGPGKGFWRRRRLLNGMPYCHQGVLMKTAVIRAFKGFDEIYSIAGDYDLILRLHLAHRRIVFAGSPYCVFRTGGASVHSGTEDISASDSLIANLKLSSDDAATYRRNRLIPWGVTIRLLFHGDSTLFLASCDMIARKLRALFTGK